MSVQVDVAHLARLSRLSLSPEEAGRLEADCRRILEMAASIQGLPTEGVQPLVHAMEFVPPLRQDVHVPAATLSREEAQKGAPAFKDGFFLVPKMKD